MILAIDVDYKNGAGVAAGVTFEEWQASAPSNVYVSRIPEVEDYIPGEFYKRELPCLLALLKEHQLSPDIIIIDGNVWLDGSSTPGLGRHLYDALNGKVKVIGVAKNAFFGISENFGILRGSSRKHLYISAAGLELETAKKYILQMHGEYRIPTLLKLADRECRKRNCQEKASRS